MNSLLFVYGSLKRDASEHFRIAEGSSFIGMGRVHGRLAENTEYPALVPDENFWVEGEVHWLEDPANRFSELDAYEGDDYRREVALIYMDDGTHTEAWVYFYRF